MVRRRRARSAKSRSRKSRRSRARARVPGWACCSWATTRPPPSTCRARRAPARSSASSTRRGVCPLPPAPPRWWRRSRRTTAARTSTGSWSSSRCRGRSTPSACSRAVDPAKDVDGFHPENVGLLVQKRPRFVACTPAGIMELLRRERVELAGRRAVVVGRSDIVGKPMALLLLHADATVTVCHSRTPRPRGGDARGGRAGGGDRSRRPRPRRAREAGRRRGGRGHEPRRRPRGRARAGRSRAPVAISRRRATS